VLAQSREVVTRKGTERGTSLILVCCLVLLFPCVAGANEPPTTNRWETEAKQKGRIPGTRTDNGI